MLGVVGPSHAVVVLTAAAAERAHGEHSPQIVVDARSVQLLVAYRHVGRRDVSQRLHVACRGRRERVERHILAVVGPERVAGDAHQNLVACHLLDYGARLRTLTRVEVAVARVLVGTVHAARHLSVALAHGVEVVVCGLQHFRIAVIHIVCRRLAEPLRHVHSVPVGQVVLHGPV